MRSARVGSPGQLLDSGEEQAPQVSGDEVEQSDGSLAALAAEYGLKPSAQRPTLGKYLRELRHRWSFIMGFATARNIALYTEAKLGQLWQVLAPLLNAGVYFLIFGVIITGVSRGVPNYLPFLVTGVFVFSFTQRTFISTSKVITDSLPLIRALQFPRAALPLAYVMIELQQMVLSLGVLAVIILVSGQPITWYWLLTIPATALQIMFNAGIGLFAARVGARVNDFAQLLPFLMRTWLYMSGVLFSIQELVLQHASHAWAVTLLQLNPAAIYITLVRNSLLASERQAAFGARQFDQGKCNAYLANPNAHKFWTAYCHPTFVSSHLWQIGAAWAVVALLFGFWFFWRKEVNYGRG